MKRSTTLTTLALASALALAGCGTSGEETAGEAPETTTSAAAGTGSTDTATATPSTSAQAVTEEHNDADTMFAQMMIPHHEQAVQMSEVMLAKDDLDPDIEALANKIVAAQGPEIDQLKTMLETWGEPTSMESGGMEGMDHGSDSGAGMEGMMTEEQMQELEAAEGTEAAEMYLTMMTAHHRGAIDMAQEEVAEGQNPQAIEMAQKVIEDQEAEIQEMERLLQQIQG
ncbi:MULTISPECIES: DUF305 domain-containing protein [Kocuria]|uniref:DUF305 domain-containing protein n=2 Tax=Kocuria marina TaxID=223184 RepID=A0A0B0DDY5_9MICC|nr:MULTISPECIES: DUF305 domain-containing protein [Kocuria]MBX7555917.1 DUF305 domain-containing protein [Streptomyces sp. tea 10]KHE75628.1 hypothetical protein AS25_00035 [Kocuria marina]MCG7432697.1 DUF305 domain-containing protein [Kocuria indica]MCR4526800.1 DUF305 domain-containing protein [Kocuria rhizophila]MCT1617193.1 DUF305 domain-containing protein [Kocuria marina]